MNKGLNLVFLVLAIGSNVPFFAQEVPSYVPTEGLVGWWPFNGNANDESGSGNDGVANGVTPTIDRFGGVDRAYFFDGIDDHIVVQHNPNLNSYPLTVNLWMKSPGDDSDGILLTKYCCSNWHGWDIQVSPEVADSAVFTREYLRGGCLGLFQWYCGAQEQQKHRAFDDVWHMYTFRVDSNGASIFWDGELVGSQEWIGVPGPVSNSLDLYMGQAIFDNINRNYFGNLDDIGIWQTSLSNVQINELYNGVNCESDVVVYPEVVYTTIGGTAEFTALNSGATAMFSWQSDLGQGFQTLSDYGNYSGTQTESIYLSNIELSNHNQELRVIATEGNCIDTSNVVLISIMDTCLTSVTVYDTLLVSVTDTLIINLILAGVNLPGSQNTILVYPNPASTHITVDYGDFNLLTGHTLSIVNAIGQVIYSEPIENQSSYIDLSSWTGVGIYYVRIFNAADELLVSRVLVLQ